MSDFPATPPLPFCFPFVPTGEGIGLPEVPTQQPTPDALQLMAQAQLLVQAPILAQLLLAYQMRCLALQAAQQLPQVAAGTPQQLQALAAQLQAMAAQLPAQLPIPPLGHANAQQTGPELPFGLSIEMLQRLLRIDASPEQLALLQHGLDLAFGLIEKK